MLKPHTVKDAVDTVFAESHLFDLPGELVSRDQRELSEKFAVVDVQICLAHPAGHHFDDHLIFPEPRIVNLFNLELPCCSVD